MDTLLELPTKIAGALAALLLVFSTLRGPPPGSSPQRHTLMPPYQLEFDFNSWTREERRQEAYRRAEAYRKERTGEQP